MVKRKGIEYHRTTMEFDVPLYRDIKIYCAKNGLTEKEFFNGAVKERLESPELQLERIKRNLASEKALIALAEVMPERLAQIVLCAMCKKTGLDATKLKNENLQGPLRDELLQMVEYWGDVRAREYVEKQYDKMFGKP